MAWKNIWEEPQFWKDIKKYYTIPIGALGVAGSYLYNPILRGTQYLTGIKMPNLTEQNIAFLRGELERTGILRPKTKSKQAIPPATTMGTPSLSRPEGIMTAPVSAIPIEPITRRETPKPREVTETPIMSESEKEKIIRSKIARGEAFTDEDLRAFYGEQRPAPLPAERAFDLVKGYLDELKRDIWLSENEPQKAKFYGRLFESVASLLPQITQTMSNETVSRMFSSPKFRSLIEEYALDYEEGGE